MKTFENWTEQGKRDYPAILAAILNGEGLTEFLGFLAGVPFPTPGAESAPKAIRSAAIAEFRRTLRGLVDQWIDSGKLEEKQRGEEPWSRSVSVSTSTHIRPIIDMLMEYRDRNPPQVLIMGDGRFGIAPDLMTRFSAWPSPPPELKDTLLRARDFAISEFVKMLESPRRECFFRCDNCGAYFVRARAPKKDMPIYRGSYCQNCKNTGEDRKRRTLEIRSGRRKELLELAANYWPNWKQKKHGKSRTKWIAEMMNEKVIKQRICVTGKWVTQNHVEIEAEVERRKHAKG